MDEIASLLKELGAVIGGLVAIITAIKGLLDATKVRRARRDGGPEAEAATLAQVSHDVARGSTPARVKFRPSAGRLTLRMILMVGLSIAVIVGGLVYEESYGFMSDGMAYVLVGLAGLFLFVAFVCFMRLTYRGLLVVLVR
ncbi:hypothetical protein [Mesobacterium pallidum]|uniref:hypothetical protein n=1 Tax=Mesobacterium pallidum TaxID=2872037 RepID=UPI001EE3870E|nr:hypothetical protein [Mesobacterium pallidum]